MNDTRTMAWPDRVIFQACARNPDQHFEDDELSGATFEVDAKRTPVVWSGGRAMVLRADHPAAGSFAVRFLISEDRTAGIRYDALNRHLSTHPVGTMVHTSWMGSGLRIGTNRFPILKMDWVQGASLEQFVTDCVASPTPGASLQAIADAWLVSCELLMRAGMSHGDIHAGNALVASNARGQAVLRLVDYDNVWVPGIGVPCKEAGNPAFQHPDRARLTDGPYLDAFPNTLTYLSLLALAADPGLWQGHKGNDTLLFRKADLGLPSADIWSALRNNSDSRVRALADIAVQWLRDDPGKYRWLAEVVAAAESAPPVGPRAAGPNVWTRRSDTVGSTPAGPMVWPQRPGPANRAGQFGPPNQPNQVGAHRQAPPNRPPAGRGNQQWPGHVPPPPAAAVPPPPPSASTGPTKGMGRSRVLVFLLVLIALFVILGYLNELKG